jgi:pimeloyl-ACP methyl ester carboxylesterase
MTESGYLDVNGGRLYYDVTGEGVPLVFIHAGIADSRMWDEQVSFLSGQYRVIRYDTRAFGRTTSTDVEYSNRRDLLALLDHLGVRKAALVGCSRGGQIATDFTIEFPERVSALITVCAGLSGFDFPEPEEEVARFEEMERLEELGDYDALAQAEVEAWVVGFQRSSEQVDAAVRRRVYEMNRRNFDHVHEGGKLVPLDPPAAERLSSIRVPTLVIVTDLDTSYIRAAADVLARNIPGTRKYVIRNSAHVPNMEHPDEFNRVVGAFLEEVIG